MKFVIVIIVYSGALWVYEAHRRQSEISSSIEAISSETSSFKLVALEKEFMKVTSA